MADLTINGITLPGDVNNTGWWLVQDGLKGWYDSPDPKHVVDGRPSGFDGGYEPLDLNVASRVVEIIGEHEAENSELAEIEARDSLSALVKQSLNLAVTDASGTRYATGVAQGGVKVTHINETTCSFSIVVECPDPLKYGPTVTQEGSSGSAEGGGLLFPIFDVTGKAEFTELVGRNRLFIENIGNEHSWPTVIVPAPFTQVQIVSAGQVVEFTRVTTSGELRLDFAAQMAWLGNSDVSGSVTKDAFFSIPPGGAYVQFSATGGNVPFTVQSASAWL